MEKAIKVLVFDPSGHANGTTGYLTATLYWDEEHPIITTIQELKAQHYKIPNTYFSAHVELIKKTNPDFVVVEGFSLHYGKSPYLANTQMPTSQLIGVLKNAHNNVIIQLPQNVKTRWSNKVLVSEGVIEKYKRNYYWTKRPLNCIRILSPHMLDAIRHLYHFHFFGKENPLLHKDV